MMRKGLWWAMLPMVLWGLAGCAVEGNEPVRMLGAVGLRGSAEICVPAEADQLGGSLDISVPGPYVIGFRVESSLPLLTEQVGVDTVSQGNRNDFYGEELSFRYTTTPPLASRLQPEKTPIHMVIRAGALATWVAFFSFLSPTVTERLVEEVRPGDSLNLEVQFEVLGRLGGGAPAKTNKVVYPIYVFNSGFQGCPGGDIIERNGPCERVGGQDGFPINCVPVTP